MPSVQRKVTSPCFPELQYRDLWNMWRRPLMIYVVIEIVVTSDDFRFSSEIYDNCIEQHFFKSVREEAIIEQV